MLVKSFQTSLRKKTSFERLSVIIAFVILMFLITARAGQAADLITAAEINQASLNTKSYEELGRFYAHVRVKNVSFSPKSITVWSNPGWSWVVNIKSIVISQEALKNLPHLVTLKPGETYDSNLEIIAGLKTSRPITFRLGFFPNASFPNTAVGNPKLIWSNSVTLGH